MISTINRVMVVELALPALIPGLLVALHYAVQMLRPAWGHGSDIGGRRTPWIVGGMAALALGAIGAALGTALAANSKPLGLAVAAVAFLAVGLGAGSAGTSLLALLASRVAPHRRAAAASIVWMMMILGFAISAPLAGHFLDPFSNERLIAVTASVSAAAFVVSVLAVQGVEGRDWVITPANRGRVERSLRAALAQVWGEGEARRFTIFIFVSMLAYGAQERLIEPFAGLVFGMTPGSTTKLAGLQHTGVLFGMLSVALAASPLTRRLPGFLRLCTIAGCIASAVSLVAIAASALLALGSNLLRASIFALGTSNGLYAVAAIGSMMALASAGAPSREGTRMGLWGAAQAIAFGLGGLTATVFVDVARGLSAAPLAAYALVFAMEAALFLVAAALAPSGAPRTASSNGVRSPGATGAIVADVGGTASVQTYDVIVVGGGPAGATAADRLASCGRKVALIDRMGRIKPCGGAIPPRLVRDFGIPPTLLKARVRLATMVSPSGKTIDMPIDGGFVGMVDREEFDEWLRTRAERSGAERFDGKYESIERASDGLPSVRFSPKSGGARVLTARVVIGADGANSAVARQEVPNAARGQFVFAYHEVIETPVDDGTRAQDPRCEIHYRGALSPDFYAWIFPHGRTMSVGCGTAAKGFSLKASIKSLRAQTGLACVRTLRREGAPIPLKPLPRWDNGRDVVLAGDASGVVAPASGEGIYYAMLGGLLAAEAAERTIATGDARALKLARRRFMREHGRVFWVLGMMQRFWYRNDNRRERFVSICRDKDVQRLTWEAYMNKTLTRRDPLAHVRIFFKDLAHMFRLVPP
jgi:geranylgeranyl reductase